MWLEVFRVTENMMPWPDFLANHNTGDLHGDVAFMSRGSGRFFNFSFSPVRLSTQPSSICLTCEVCWFAAHALLRRDREGRPLRRAADALRPALHPSEPDLFRLPVLQRRRRQPPRPRPLRAQPAARRPAGMAELHLHLRQRDRPAVCASDRRADQANLRKLVRRQGCR